MGDLLLIAVVSLTAAVAPREPDTFQRKGQVSAKPTRETKAKDKNRLGDAYGKLPMSFEANVGQTDNRVQFVSRGSGYTLFLTWNALAVLADGIVAAIHPPEAIGKMLDCLGLPSRAPQIASAAGRSSPHPDEPV